MAKGDSMLICPECGQFAEVKPGSSGHRNANGELPRVRRCPADHEVRTLERIVQPALSQLRVRTPAPPGSRSVHQFRDFDQAVLLDRLRANLFGTLEPHETRAVVDAATARLELALSRPGFARALPEGKESRGTRGKTHFVTHLDVRDAILTTLREVGRPEGGGGNARFRVAHVMYALATLGRVPPTPSQSQPGWRTAAEFARWLVVQYPTDLGDYLPDTSYRGYSEDTWWRPEGGPPTQPVTVVKRHAKLRRRGIAPPRQSDFLGTEPFVAELDEARRVESPVEPPAEPVELLAQEAEDRGATSSPTVAGVPVETFAPHKFQRSVHGVLMGRGHLPEETAENIVDWVLWQLVGQQVILSSQLGAAVADCLRRVDDIAYLRWVTVGKELRVSSLHRETMGLITHPSPRLIFDPARQPKPQPGRLPGR